MAAGLGKGAAGKAFFAAPGVGASAPSRPRERDRDCGAGGRCEPRAQLLAARCEATCPADTATNNRTRRSLVETDVFRYKTIIGRRLHARTLPNQRIEAKIGCNVFNRMTRLGMPASVRIV